ncbi:MAG: hypothetical protein RLZZ568_2086 [Cyanobacteriota bacterium]
MLTSYCIGWRTSLEWELGSELSPFSAKLGANSFTRIKWLLMHALSIPTWMVHVSSVIEWITAIALVCRYARKTGYAHWRALAWGMLPALVSATCACTWHFFDNLPDLNWLVTLQALTTVVGNGTLCIAAWWIWRRSRPTASLD